MKSFGLLIIFWKNCLLKVVRSHANVFNDSGLWNQ